MIKMAITYITHRRHIESSFLFLLKLFHFFYDMLKFSHYFYGMFKLSHSMAQALSCLSIQAHCFHSLSSFIIIIFNSHLVMVPLPKVLLLMNFLYFFCLQELFSLCFEVENETMRMMTLLMQDFLLSNTKLLVKSVWKGVVLNHFMCFYYFNLLMMKEVEDQIKALSTIWYLNFLMTWYENSRWVEHFQITRKVIL